MYFSVNPRAFPKHFRVILAGAVWRPTQVTE